MKKCKKKKLILPPFLAALRKSWIEILRYRFIRPTKRILAYQRHLYIRRHVKYPGSANIPRNARNVLRVYRNHLSLSLSLLQPSFPFVTRSAAAVFPQWTISHVPSSVPAPERFTALALYVCPCVFIAGHFYAFISARAPRVLDQSFPLITDVKKKIAIYPTRVKGNLKLVTFASSMYLFISSPPPPFTPSSLILAVD